MSPDDTTSQNKHSNEHHSSSTVGSTLSMIESRITCSVHLLEGTNVFSAMACIRTRMRTRPAFCGPPLTHACTPTHEH